MAAKVAIVAVPTVLSIASIRVYTVREVPTDGLVPRRELNIYTPVPSSAQAQFVPETPGFIQSGITTTRESILPIFQAVKGACLSVKRGSVNLYHAGEDVFYYLKDPPPEFLPRFGTITMAGLLGMFLARKGSRFKRVAVPLGLMSVGTSVCYPAQAVAVVKVTGKKVYAAGKWSSATVSLLLTPKPQEPATETAASEPKAVKVPNLVSAVTEEASAQSSTITETEVESAESIPVSDEPVVPIRSEEVSLVALAEISANQTPADTDPVVESVPAETKTTTASEEIPAPLESEEPSDTKQAAENGSIDTSPAESTPSLEQVEVASAEAASAESAPVEAAPVEATPVEAALVKSALAESAPVEAAAVEAAPEEVAPVEAAAVEAAPVEAAPVEAAPVETAPVEAAAVEATPVEATAVEAAPEEVAPVEAAAVEAAPVEATAVEAAPEEVAPVEAAPVEAAPVEAVPVEAVPVEATPVEATPVEAMPVEAAPVEAAPEEEVKSVPSSEEPVPVVESAEPEPAPQPESADPPQVAAVEESPTLTPPPPQEPAAENSKGGSSFKPDPALMDFGQSNPEDEDLYSTRS